MQVILLEKIHKLGSLGDLANVKAGYARNFLIPTGKVKLATQSNLAEFEKNKAELEAKEAKILILAEEKQQTMQDCVCEIIANASEEGKLFGSISAADITNRLADYGHVVEKRNIDISDAIQHTGEYDINISLHTDINVKIKLIVKAKEITK